jgi:hypothetical protein
MLRKRRLAPPPWTPTSDFSESYYCPGPPRVVHAPSAFAIAKFLSLLLVLLHRRAGRSTLFGGFRPGQWPPTSPTT